MDRVLVAEYMECFVVAGLLDIAMGGEVLARGIPRYEVLPR